MTEPTSLERALARAIDGVDPRDPTARAIAAGLRGRRAEDPPTPTTDAAPALNDPALERSLLAALNHNTARED